MAAGDRQSNEHVVEEVHDGLCRGLNGKSFKVILVGPPGVGKSTLVNTILMRPECRVSRGAAAVTDTVTRHQITVPLHDSGEATLDVYDSPGFNGDEEEDERTTEDLRQVGEPDILLICFAMDADGGRYTPMRHGFILDRIKNIWGETVMADRAILVLTKCNLVWNDYESRQQAGRPAGVHKGQPTSFRSEVDGWNRLFIRSQRSSALANIPVCIAGRVEFGTNNKPNSVTKIEGSAHWLQELWNTVAGYSDSGLAPLLYVAANNIHQDPTIPDQVKTDLPKPNSASVLSKVLIFAAGFATASAAIAVLGTMGPAGAPMAMQTAKMIAGGASVVLGAYVDNPSAMKAISGLAQMAQSLGLHWGFLKE